MSGCTNPRHAPDPGRNAAMAAIARRYRTDCPGHIVRDHTPPRQCLGCGGSTTSGYADCRPDGAILRGYCSAFAGCGGTPWRHHVTWAALDRFVAAPQMSLSL